MPEVWFNKFLILIFLYSVSWGIYLVILSSKFNFPFSLLADEDKSVCNAFGIWGPKKFMGKEYDGIHRTTFVIDENGTIKYTEQVSEIADEPNYDAALNSL